MFKTFVQRPIYDGKLAKMWPKDKNYKSQNIRAIPFPNFKRLKKFERGWWGEGSFATNAHAFIFLGILKSL